jgi:hypothetical protein
MKKDTGCLANEKAPTTTKPQKDKQNKRTSGAGRAGRSHASNTAHEAAVLALLQRNVDVETQGHVETSDKVTSSQVKAST